MKDDGSRIRQRLPLTLLAGSGASLLLGLTMPVAILLDNSPSVMVYGLILLSFPLWLLGCILAGIAGGLLDRRQPNQIAIKRITWTLGILNLLAILLCLAWQPAGVS